MAVTAHSYTEFAKQGLLVTINFTSDTLKAMLLSAYTPGQDTHAFISDVLAAGTEASGTGYTAGGQTLTSVTYVKSGHVYTLDAADFSWNATGGSLSGAYIVFYKSTGTPSTSPVFCYWDLGGTQTASNALFSEALNASGLLTLTGA